MRKFIFLLILGMAGGFCLFPAAARADCATATMGNQPEGAIFYNNDLHLMEYCDDTDWIAMNVAGSGSGPTGCTNIGDVCDDGTVYAGLSPDGNVKMYTTAADEGGFAWDNGNSSGYTTTSQTDAATGETNTVNLLTIDSDSGTGGTQPHLAAQQCANSTANGHSDWYLPAKDELSVLFTNRAAIGGFNISGLLPAGYYWSSSEYSNDFSWGQRFSGGVPDYGSKADGLSVRCVRKSSTSCSTATMGPQPEGKLLFNADSRVLEVCAGSVWRPMGPVGSSSLGTGLVAHWKLDESSGSTAADSAGSNDGTVSGGVTFISGGKVGGAAVFDGVDGKIDAGTIAAVQNASALTISAWMRRAAPSDMVAIGSCDNSGGDVLDIDMWTDGNLYFDVKNGGDSYGNVALNDTAWHHVAMVFDGTQAGTDRIRGYVDGVEQTLSYLGSPPATTPATTSPWTLGYVGCDITTYSTGTIDDVRIYGRALSAQEVAEIHAAAGCANPARPEGTLLYNSDAHVMQYCDGRDWVAIGKSPEMAADPCAGSPSPGDVCADGTVYAGLSPDGNMKMYTTAADESSLPTPWNNGNSTGYTTTSQTSTTTGEGNTTNLLSIDSDSGTAGTQPHQAAQLCADSTLNGHSDWYLPGKDELNVLYTNRTDIGGFNTSGSFPLGHYWSSSEVDNSNAWLQKFSDGSPFQAGKYIGLSVRCVRKD